MSFNYILIGPPNWFARLFTYLRNFNQTDGLCNGTMMVVTQIMTEKDVGERVLIPRIQLTSIDTMYPSTFRRRQYQEINGLFDAIIVVSEPKWSSKLIV